MDGSLSGGTNNSSFGVIRSEGEKLYLGAPSVSAVIGLVRTVVGGLDSRLSGRVLEARSVVVDCGAVFTLGEKPALLLDEMLSEVLHMLEGFALLSTLDVGFTLPLPWLLSILNVGFALLLPWLLSMLNEDFALPLPWLLSMLEPRSFPVTSWLLKVVLLLWDVKPAVASGFVSTAIACCGGEGSELDLAEVSNRLLVL